MPETIHKLPMRRCIGCKESYPQQELIRFTFADGELKIDEEKKADGRGSYICRKKQESMTMENFGFLSRFLLRFP